MATLKKIEEQTIVTAAIKRFGEAIVVPEEMTLGEAVTVLQSAASYEEKLVQKEMIYPNDPYEVAHAFGTAVRAVLGTALGADQYHWWGRELPKEIAVQTEVGKYTQVLWGKLMFPFEPTDETGLWIVTHQASPVSPVNGRVVGKFKQKYNRIWEKILEQTSINLTTESLFKGKTLRVKFTDAGRQPLIMADIQPWDVSGASTAKLVFSRKLEEEIEDHILTPIRHKELIESVGTPFKRGVLLAGPYGTGKTELAAAVARLAASNGMTVVYIEDVRELPHAVRFVSRLAPGIVFAEDLDRVTSDERDHEVDVLLNTLDGIDTKQFPVMTIMTTNYAERIYKGMVRPGRIDVALQIGPPDAEAAIRLVRGYLGELFSDDKESDEVERMGRELEGMIPAVIREITERSKLSAISRMHKKPEAGSIKPVDVLRAAGSMKNQLELLNHKEVRNDTETIEQLIKESTQEGIRRYYGDE